jgi:hypothetical protein
MHLGDPNDDTGDRFITLVLAGLCSARTSFSRPGPGRDAVGARPHRRCEPAPNRSCFPG